MGTTMKHLLRWKGTMVTMKYEILSKRVKYSKTEYKEQREAV